MATETWELDGIVYVCRRTKVHGRVVHHMVQPAPWLEDDGEAVAFHSMSGCFFTIKSDDFPESTVFKA